MNRRSTGNIILSPKYGANPTMEVCFWCCKETGVIAMLGKIKHALAVELIRQQIGCHGDAHDLEAPRKMVMNREPCPSCASVMATGITLMEANEGDGGKPEPTGSYWVMTEEWARRTVRPGVLLDSMLKTRKAHVAPEVAEELGLNTVEPTHKHPAQEGTP